LRRGNPGTLFEPFENRDGKRRCLASTGAGLPEDVFSLEGNGDYPLLDGTRMVIAGLLEGRQHDVGYPQIAERADGRGLGERGAI
jgi:hypothetical protein